jgi:hypothetical protein
MAIFEPLLTVEGPRPDAEGNVDLLDACSWAERLASWGQQGGAGAVEGTATSVPMLVRGSTAGNSYRFDRVWAIAEV